MERIRKATPLRLPVGRYVCRLATVASLLIGITFLSASCEKESTSLGIPVQVRISIGGAVYPSDEMVTRSAAGDGRTLETITVGLNAGWHADASLVEDAGIPTRSSTPFETIDDGALFQVVVYDADGNYVAHDEHVYDASKQYLEGDPFTLTTGEQYTVVAYSYNRTVDDTYFSYGYDSSDDKIEISAYPNYDLLWGKSQSVTIAGPNHDIPVAVSHKFTRIRINAKISGGTSPVITGMAVTLPELDYHGVLTVKTGEITSSGKNGDSQNISFTPLNTNDVRSDYQLVYAGGAGTNIVTMNHLEIQDQGSPQTVVNTSAPRPIEFHQALEGGKSYTLQINIDKNVWASSNIYWKGGVHSYLTFEGSNYNPDAPGAEAHKYQGIYFIWGSLVGISPVGNSFTTSTPIYVPTFASGADPNAKWEEKTIGTIDFSSHNDGVGNTNAVSEIPYVTDAVTGDRNSKYLYDLPSSSYNDYKGDICKYLVGRGAPAGNWRMPTSAEYGTIGGPFDSENPETIPVAGGWTMIDPTNAIWTSGATSNKEDGTFVIPIGGLYKGMFFPTGGDRYTNGTLHGTTGKAGRYWSGSASNIVRRAYHMVIEKTYLDPQGTSADIAHSFLVRCIKDN